MKLQTITKCKFQGGVGGSPTADSRFVVPCPTGQERSPKSTPQLAPNRYITIRKVQNENRIKK